MFNIYLDFASTTSVDPQVVKAMAPYWTDIFGNPSNLYEIGRQAFSALEKSRDSIAKNLNCLSEEIIFTSGGTESCNLALQGLARNFPQGHIIISAIEHHAVLNSANYLKRQGFDLTIVKPEKNGIIDPQKIKDAICDKTFLISVMWVNNEIGTIQPIKKISRMLERINQQRIARAQKKIYFHTDACQAGLYIKIDFKKITADLLSLNGSKIYGPKGAGILFVRQKTPLAPLFFGGDQELGLRPGTQPVALYVGLAKAIELVENLREKENKRLAKLQNYLMKKLRQKFPNIILNGDEKKRIAANVNISVPAVEGEALSLMLDEEAVMVATGSACASSDLKPSHVLTALGISDELAHSSIRITMGRSTTKKDLDYFLISLEKVYKKLKQISAITEFL
ncbi:MAG: cysteine desulfurase [Candidatus Berkelbacteria bacterium Licking1014_7]|uniref:Cysteine desulfurase n=1 Tax=Candidatus Berkelbacteria bacterium Licking1014_7 TaxID=2017147 RepID=A0A554LIV8_9BACT|nr:MAG: cysteine desulfurase [Candidatus Berkelbacteria bacterium Licking1014_7]